MIYPFSVFDPTTTKLIYLFTVSLVLWGLLQLLTKTFVNQLAQGSPRGRRLRTLTSVVRTLISTVIIGFALFQTLSVLGFDLAPLLASAGIAAFAIGFGAQTLVKDIISGFFLLAEDQFDEGDEIEISGKRGLVEKITLRTVWIREKNGTLHMVPTGSITLVSNFSRGNSQKQREKLDKR
ncbi:MAG TPA: mechanosensitive ion channel domain-containing protein [Candidatus Nanoarchaeia archaeon]|nr:small-conductance mechanosensitive channel [uncultured archaeon]